MGNRTKRAPGRPKHEPQRPSLFFIVALVLGVALVMWFLIKSAGTPARPPAKKTSALLESGADRHGPPRGPRV